MSETISKLTQDVAVSSAQDDLQTQPANEPGSDPPAVQMNLEPDSTQPTQPSVEHHLSSSDHDSGNSVKPTNAHKDKDSTPDIVEGPSETPFEHSSQESTKSGVGKETTNEQNSHVGEEGAELGSDSDSSKHGSDSDTSSSNGTDRKSDSERSSDSDSDSQSDSDSDSDSEFERGKLDLERELSMGGRLHHRKKQAGRKLVDSLRYIVLIENRIKKLERTVSKLNTEIGSNSEKKETSPARSSTSEANENRPKKLELEPLKLGLKDFIVRRVSKEATHVLEILTEEIVFIPDRPSRKFRDRGGESDRRDDTRESNRKIKNSRRIERIRINSSHIIAAFRTLGLEISTTYSDGCELLKPFKPLIFYKDGLKEHLRTLELAQSAPREEDKDEIVHAAFSEEAPDAPDTGSAIESANDAPPADSSKECPPSSKADTTKDERPYKEQEAIEHIQCLLDYMEKDADMQEYVEKARKLRNREVDRVSFDDLWHLFAPGDLVLEKGSNKQAYQVEQVYGGRQILGYGLQGRVPERGLSVWNYNTTGQYMIPFRMVCIFTDFDGQVFGPREKSFEIAAFEGDMAIQDLRVVPLELRDGESKETLLAAGKNYRDIADNIAHREYTNLSAGEHREWIDSEIIIDQKLYYQLHPDANTAFGFNLSNTSEAAKWDIIEVVDEWEDLGIDTSENACLFDDFAVDDARREDHQNRVGAHVLTTTKTGKKDLTDDHLRLLPTEVPAYVLKARKWDIVEVSNIKVIKQNSQNFKDLVLEKSTRRLVESLVRNHAKGELSAPEEGIQQDDLVRGKGKGVIILLHGVPGVGKTSTAECVAEATKRPLYPITCGDIGDTAQDVQKNLEETFQLARRWGCVLLLDEADVFLQARDKEDMKRNAIVSVFLRILEYYSGILFLTTNKVGQFDEAFKSRIHVSLYYPPLNTVMFERIWSLNMRRTEENKPKLSFDAEAIRDWSQDYWYQSRKEKRQAWNGRQIHNAFQTAIALAEFDGTQLEPKHFDMVAAASKQFDDYLAQIHGTDSKRAKLYQDRYDAYDDRNEREPAITSSRRRPDHGPRYGSFPGDTPSSRRSYNHDRDEGLHRLDDHDEHDVDRDRGGFLATPQSHPRRRGFAAVGTEDDHHSDRSSEVPRTRVTKTPERYADVGAERAAQRGPERSREWELRERQRERERDRDLERDYE
ncbi:hypothetical protein MBLNU459_g0172t1 [Dothideomycetes sp. NU459]